jgi:hypothetical protein
MSVSRSPLVKLNVMLSGETGGALGICNACTTLILFTDVTELSDIPYLEFQFTH